MANMSPGVGSICCLAACSAKKHVRRVYYEGAIQKQNKLVHKLRLKVRQLLIWTWGVDMEDLSFV